MSWILYIFGNLIKNCLFASNLKWNLLVSKTRTSHRMLRFRFRYCIDVADCIFKLRRHQGWQLLTCREKTHFLNAFCKWIVRSKHHGLTNWKHFPFKTFTNRFQFPRLHWRPWAGNELAFVFSRNSRSGSCHRFYRKVCWFGMEMKKLLSFSKFENLQLPYTL